jgi:hypothetical protein
MARRETIARTYGHAKAGPGCSATGEDFLGPSGERLEFREQVGGLDQAAPP